MLRARRAAMMAAEVAAQRQARAVLGGRKDWVMMLVGALGTICAEAALPGESLRRMFAAALGGAGGAQFASALATRGMG